MADNNLEYFISDNTFSGSNPDPLRNEIGLLVSYDAENEQVVLNNTNPQRYVSDISGTINTSEEVIEDLILFEQTKKNINVFGESENIKNDNEWKAILLGGTYATASFGGLIDLTQKRYLNINFSTPTYFGSDKNNSFEDQLNYKIRSYPAINYSNLNYNEFVNRSGELRLPNIYLFYSHFDGQFNNTGNADRLVKYSTYTTKNCVEQPTGPGAIKTSGGGVCPAGTGMNYEINSYISSLSGITDRELQQYRNIFVGGEKSFQIFKDAEEIEAAFPQHYKTEFVISNANRYSQYLISNQLDHKFMKDVYKGLNGLNPDISFFEVSLNQIKLDKEARAVPNSVGWFDTVGTLSSSHSVRAFDVTNWWFSTIEEDRTLGSEHYYILGELDIDAKMATTYSSSFRYEKYNDYIHFANSVAERTPDVQKITSFTIDDLNEAESTDIFYRIAKIKTGDPSGDLRKAVELQNYYIFSPEGVGAEQTVPFIDTQVKIGEEYTYVYYAYKLVEATSYYYDNVQYTKPVTLQSVQNEDKACIQFYDAVTETPVGDVIKDVDGSSPERYQARADLVSEPALILLEIPMFTHSFRYVPDPPSAVEVLPFHFQNVKNLTSFKIAISQAQYDREPRAITNADEEYFENVRKLNISTSNSFTFGKSSSPVRTIEVYRLDKMPEAYSDFGGNLIDIVDVYDFEDAVYKNLVKYHSSLQMNKKYYYVFKPVDEQENPGYPSPVFEITLIEDSEYIYLEAEVVELKSFTELNVDPSHKLERFLHIKPNINNRLFNYENVDFSTNPSGEDILNKMSLGISDDVVWDKKFKIRLTSKKSGKKIDYNLTFKISRDET